jgi:hypothetical protein
MKDCEKPCWEENEDASDEFSEKPSRQLTRRDLKRLKHERRESEMRRARRSVEA